MLLLGGCTIRPHGVLSGRKMEQVLYDLHRTDGVLQVSGLYYRQESEVNPYYLWVMEKNGITQAQFDSSLVWYTDNPQIFNKIYPRVIRRLEEERTALIRQFGERGEVKRKEFVPTKVDTLLVPVLFHKYGSVYEILSLLPPTDTLVGTLGTGGVVLEVGEHRGVNTDMESVGLIRSEGDKTGGHRPAMQVAGDVNVGI